MPDGGHRENCPCHLRASCKSFLASVWVRRRRVWWLVLTVSILILVLMRTGAVGAHDPTFLDKGALGLVALCLHGQRLDHAEGTLALGVCVTRDVLPAQC